MSIFAFAYNAERFALGILSFFFSLFLALFLDGLAKIFLSKFRQFFL